MRQDLTSGHKALRSLGLTILFMTVIGAGTFAFTVLSGDAIEGWRRQLVALSLLLAAVAALVMMIDAFDLWMLGRRITAFSVKMVHSLVFVAMLAAIVLSVVTKTSGLLLLVTPALAIYLFTVVKPLPAPGKGRSRAQPGRQKRGGKKRS